MGGGWWKNGLVWRTAATALVLSAISPAMVAALDHVRYVSCQVPTRKIKQGALIADTDLRHEQSRRSAIPRDSVTAAKDAIGRTAARDLLAGQCVAAHALKAAPLTFEFPLTEVHLVGTPMAGKTADLLFAPIDGRDSRDGASVNGVIVINVDSNRVLVELTKEDQQTILKYVGRSRLTIRAR